MFSWRQIILIKNNKYTISKTVLPTYNNRQCPLIKICYEITLTYLPTTVAGLTLSLAIVAIATKNIEWLQVCHWLKVHSRWFKNYIFAEKYILISFCIFPMLLLLFLHNFNIMVPYFTLWMLNFFNTMRVSNSFGSRSGQTKCRAWSGSKLFAKAISREQKSPLACKELHVNTKQLVDTTFWIKPRLKLISFGSDLFHLAQGKLWLGWFTIHINNTLWAYSIHCIGRQWLNMYSEKCLNKK